MKSKLKKRIVLDEGGCPNPKQPGPQGAAKILRLSNCLFLWTICVESARLDLTFSSVMGGSNDQQRYESSTAISNEGEIFFLYSSA
ncbi:hypothetical protein BES34_018875 [Leptospira inadai serovar Lyme]|uniref:Uncharacterized protein n=1 Tax=Leptospira inadai serovar Lyme TaxID=293084 RepID=A0ABX4YE04_9LEPT|nr:hypothetical protein BES34_018875 [Leptospira inadai serovar Lyme]